MNNDEKTINLLNDAMFKSLVRSPEAREIVLKVIQDSTKISFEFLQKAEFMGGEIPKSHIKEKGKISDVIIKIDSVKIILEMNQFYTKEIFDKNLQYAYAWNTRESKRNRTFLINFDAFDAFHTDKPLLDFFMRDQEKHEESKLIASYHLILENYKNSHYNISEETKTFMELLQTKATMKELKEKYKGNEVYEKLMKKIEQLTQDEEFLGYYDLEEKHKWELNDSYETGVEQGIKQGMHQNKLDMAKKMLKQHEEISKIILYTGLAKEEITSLK